MLPVCQLHTVVWCVTTATSVPGIHHSLFCNTCYHCAQYTLQSDVYHLLQLCQVYTAFRRVLSATCVPGIHCSLVCHLSRCVPDIMCSLVWTISYHFARYTLQSEWRSGIGVSDTLFLNSAYPYVNFAKLVPMGSVLPLSTQVSGFKPGRRFTSLPSERK